MSEAAIGTVLLFAALAILMIARIPIAFSLAISAMITATYLGIPYFNLFQKMSVSLISFTFIAVPFFIMMAQVMTDGEITKKLMAFCNIIVGRVRGGTAIVNILVSMLFGGISGSSAADVSSIGAMLIPAYAIAMKKKYPLGGKHSLKENIKIVTEAILGLGAIVIVIAGTSFGVCSATEAAAVAAVYALVITVAAYRNMTVKKYVEGLKKCLPTMTMAMVIISASGAFSYVMSYLKVPQNLTAWLLSLTSDKILLTLLLLIMMLILGCFMDMGILILLTTPILYPIATGVLGFNPYHFGVVLVLAYGIGLCTPPVGTSLFIGCSIAKTPVEKVVRGFMPFYLSMVLMLLLLTFIPALSLGLPRLLGLL